ncbi:hypothetical protein [Nocardia bovistercoris]|uniref:Uncharacterized protein n=1 Tax=Nocardia bovistercoris TaxID=2785916 RepID=A0A931N2V7_9NOCA|nr:hypothetical protein [Nocardia bovistercoris]MBH0775928.1 hypothetical protein [Nocardia bovistercoris]
MEPTTQAIDETSGDPVWIDYAEFGERFVTHAVTERRIESAVAGIAGRGVRIGPFSVGPAGLAGFVAEGKMGRPSIVRHDPHVIFQLTVPISLTVKLLLGGRKMRLSTVVDIGLTLHARTADPLLIVIDIPPVQASDVRIALRARALEAEWEFLLDPIAGVVQREVANRVNALLAEPQARRGRIFDIEAILDGVDSAHRGRDDFDWIDYGEFGRRFFDRVVTAERVGGVLERMTGRPIEIGPLRTGPGRRATVTVRGAIRVPRVRARPEAADSEAAKDGPVSFDVTVPVGLDITVDVLKANRYRADVEIPLSLTARAADPLLVVIDVPPPDARDIRLEFKAHGMRAATLGVLAKIKKQIVGRVAGVVRDQLESGAERVIDVAARLDALG